MNDQAVITLMILCIGSGIIGVIAGNYTAHKKWTSNNAAMYRVEHGEHIYSVMRVEE